MGVDYGGSGPVGREAMVLLTRLIPCLPSATADVRHADRACIHHLRNNSPSLPSAARTDIPMPTPGSSTNSVQGDEDRTDPAVCAGSADDEAG